MFDYLVLLLVAMIALSGASCWVIPIGAAGLCLDGWSDRRDFFKKALRKPPDRQVAAYFVSSLSIALFASSAAYVIGFVARRFWA